MHVVVFKALCKWMLQFLAIERYQFDKIDNISRHDICEFVKDYNFLPKSLKNFKLYQNFFLKLNQ